MWKKKNVHYLPHTRHHPDQLQSVHKRTKAYKRTRKRTGNTTKRLDLVFLLNGVIPRFSHINHSPIKIACNFNQSGNLWFVCLFAHQLLFLLIYTRISSGVRAYITFSLTILCDSFVLLTQINRWKLIKHSSSHIYLWCNKC